MILLKSKTKSIRSEVEEYIKKEKEKNPNYKIIDIGGASNPWLDNHVDAYFDIQNFNTNKQLIQGDLNNQQIWSTIESKSWDFSICTHVLEDVRDPILLLNNIIRISKKGFIAVPNCIQEFKNIESDYWLGYCHHRWLFSINQNSELYIIPKLPLINIFNNKPNNHIFLDRIFNRNTDSFFLDNLDRITSIEKKINTTKLDNIDELGILWIDTLDNNNIDFFKSGQEIFDFYYNLVMESS